MKKFKLMHITKRKTPIHSDLHLNNKILEVTSEFRDLGLVTDCNLCWSTHFDKISNKDKKILGLIKRTSRCFHIENSVSCPGQITARVLQCSVVTTHV